ncbi:hypothetical protein, partial [Streptomyces nanshensis]
PAPPLPPAAVPVRPRADCTADTAGGLTFDVRLSEAGPAAPCATGDPAMLLRLRGGEGPADTVRLPLAPVGDEGTLRAVLPSIMSLPEGRWDAYVADGDEEPVRLLPGVHDLRSLVDRVPRAGRTWLGVRIPYATKYGNLTVRSWLRWPHAEAGQLYVLDGGLVVRGRLYGAGLSTTARLEAHPRDAAGTPPVSVPVPCDGEEHAGPDDARHSHQQHSRERHVEGQHRQVPYSERQFAPQGRGQGQPEPHAAPGFTVRLPLGALPSGPVVWDLWLRPSAEEEPVRLARILDDVPDKKQIFGYPPQLVTAPDGTVREVRPYYTLDNDLSVQASWPEPV